MPQFLVNHMEMENEIAGIKERNKRVEGDKAWETSKTRRGLIAAATYVAAVAFLTAINAPNPFANALVPTAAYLVSTLSLPFVKNWWTENIYSKGKP